uniref:Uncharacterized protein n=1 Tax=Schistosoma curassoni TaxID=6186 RepID=A0A183KAU3_9TREM
MGLPLGVIFSTITPCVFIADSTFRPESIVVTEEAKVSWLRIMTGRTPCAINVSSISRIVPV